LPHSAISGSPRVCHSPELLAAYHGLHRLRVPRHPPHAFLRLTTIDVCQAELRALFQRVTFSCEKVISIKDSLNPTIYHASVVKQHRPSLARTPRGQQSRVDGQNVSRRSDYEMLSPSVMRDGYSRSVKEVIQPQVPLRLPCYDFAPVTALAFGRLAPCGFRHGLRALTASMA
jgi:hypothetical protein